MSKIPIFYGAGNLYGCLRFALVDNLIAVYIVFCGKIRYNDFNSVFYEKGERYGRKIRIIKARVRDSVY